MKKSKILAAVMFIAMFSSLFTVANYTTTPASVSTALPASVAPEAFGDALGSKGVWAEDVTGETIIIDGDLADWTGFGARHETFNGIDVYLGYDATYVYLACAWEDATENDTISYWNKTGSSTLDNATHGTWEELPGADDILKVGFRNSTGWTDYWIWTGSLKGDPGYAYEVNGTGHDDNGNLPYIYNWDTTTHSDWRQPATDDGGTAIGDHDALANGTMYVQWRDQTPTAGQTDVVLDYLWNDTGDDRYVVEFRRLLDAPDLDDVDFDFTDIVDLAKWKFYVGAEDEQDAFDFACSTNSYNIEEDAQVNDVPYFEWFNIVGAQSSAIITQGNCWDDFVLDPDDFMIHLSGWEDTIDTQHNYLWRSVVGDINSYTGNWSHLFGYNADDMPLGDFTMNVSWTPKYDNAYFNFSYQNVSIVDTTAPTVFGLVDVNYQYPCGVPNGTEYVTVTVGVGDDYAFWNPTGGLYQTGQYETTNMLSVLLYSYKDDDVALMTPMIHFAPGANTYSCNITLPALAAGETHNYTYFVEVWDTENNKVTSVKYWFYHGEYCVTTPGFGILAGLFGVAAVAFIIVYKKRK